MEKDVTSHYHGGSLHSKRFQSSYWAKVRAEAKKRLKGEGEGRRGNLHSPLPPPSFFFFFCSCPSFLDEPREETLATQATMVVKYLDHNNGELNENGKKTVGLY